MSSTDARSSSVVNKFLQLFMQDRDQGTTRSLADYQAMFPADPDVIAVEYELLTNGDAPADVAYPAHGDRYREARTIGSGGMATVLRVFDPSLERDVAMKRMLCEQGKLPDAHTLARFLEEAKVTGQLQHPGIVSVFEIGLDAERRPYFTMPVIAGRSLHEIITAMHQGDQEWSQLRVLGVLVRVCEAVAYAHERGVVHRDLKPANVMVGQFGETYVVDWGLAQCEGRSDCRDIRIRDDDGSLDAADSALRTMEGDVIGTPAYMAPEQARGELQSVGKASDIYSLGAMLYHLLAGTPPFIESDEHPTGRVTLQRVLAGAPDSVSIKAPTTPPELAAICELAMNRGAANRYSSVAKLGTDLRAYLENRVVHAYKNGPLAELRKWVRRNRGVAVASIAAVLALAVGFVWSEVHRREADANALLASDNAVLAAQNLDLAFEAGDELLGDLGYYGIQNQPGADPVREVLLTKSLAYYERFRALRGSDRRVETKVAKALFRIAILHTTLGHTAEAIPALQAARSAAEAAIRNLGEIPELRRNIILIGIEENVRLLQSGEVKAAIVGLERAGAAVAEMQVDEPESPNLRRASINVAYNLALAMIEVRNRKGALKYSASALEIAQRIAEEADVPSAQALLGSAQMLRAKLMWQLGENEKATPLYEAAAKTLETARAKHPEHRGIRYRLGEVSNHHAILLRQTNRPEEAEALFERAIALFRELAIANPGARNYHGNLGGALCNLGIMNSLRGDYASSVPVLEEALLEIRRSLSIDAKSEDFRGFRVIAARELAIALLETGHHVKAADVVRELMRDQPRGNHFRAGKLLAACANACMADEAQAPDVRVALVSTLGDEAIALLREAVAQGTVKGDALESSAFRSIREHADFQALVEQLKR